MPGLAYNNYGRASATTVSKCKHALLTVDNKLMLDNHPIKQLDSKCLSETAIELEIAEATCCHEILLSDDGTLPGSANQDNNLSDLCSICWNFKQKVDKKNVLLEDFEYTTKLDHANDEELMAFRKAEDRTVRDLQMWRVFHGYNALRKKREELRRNCNGASIEVYNERQRLLKGLGKNAPNKPRNKKIRFAAVDRWMEDGEEVEAEPRDRKTYRSYPNYYRGWFGWTPGRWSARCPRSASSRSWIKHRCNSFLDTSGYHDAEWPDGGTMEEDFMQRWARVGGEATMNHRSTED